MGILWNASIADLHSFYQDFMFACILLGVTVLEDQPVPILALSSTPPCVKADILSASVALMSSSTTSAIIAKPSAVETFISAACEKEEKMQPSGPSGVEDTPLDKGVMKKLPNISLSQYDILKTGISFEPWSSENSLIISEHLSNPKCFKRDKCLDASAQDRIVSSCPQCHTVAAKGNEGRVESYSSSIDDMKEHHDDSEGEVAIALVDNSLPGDSLLLHEPIKIVITMSSTQTLASDLEDLPCLKVPGTEKSSSDPDSGVAMADQHNKQRNDEQERIPVITFELSENSVGQDCQEANEGLRMLENVTIDTSSNPCSGYESAEPDNIKKEHSEKPSKNHAEISSNPENASENVVATTLHSKNGEQNLGISSYKMGQEKRHARVLSVDSGTDALLSKNSTETVSDKEKLLPTSKSELEAKEGQIPNESNFLEFVSLLESLNTSKATESDCKSESANNKRLIGGEQHAFETTNFLGM